MSPNPLYNDHFKSLSISISYVLFAKLAPTILPQASSGSCYKNGEKQTQNEAAWKTPQVLIRVLRSCFSLHSG